MSIGVNGRRRLAGGSIVALALLGITAGAAAPQAPGGRVDFARDIQPIFQASCYKCHAGAMRMGLLRLDAKGPALEGGVSGAVIVPGHADRSEILKRLTHADPAQRMPFRSDPLATAQIDLIRRWIDEGAAWPEAPAGAEAKVERHWSYVRPVRPPLPSVKNAAWVRNPLDAFVLARLDKEGIAPAPEASREALLRRVTLDLTGLPPTPAEIDAFAADRSPEAYTKVVDRLLASPRYGERWARPWLDLARYADSNGYDEDRLRVMWKYRDWVIDALNRDLPFDRFTVEQIAGDMLPSPTLAQRIASGFHANTMLNEEGGVDGEEARFEVLVDRVNTTASVWLGSTLGCAQCHNHKYDPFPQKDYYGMIAFFDNGVVTIDKRGGANAVQHDPVLRIPTPEQEAKLRVLEEEIAARRRTLETDTPELAAARTRWVAETRALVDAWRGLTGQAATAAGGARIALQPDGSFLVSGPNPASDTYTVTATLPLAGAEALRLELLPDPSLPDSGPGRGPNGGFDLSEIRVEARSGNGGDFTPLPIAAAVADGSVVGGTVAEAIDGKDDTGWSVAARKEAAAIFLFKSPVSTAATLRITLEHKTLHPQHGLGRFRLSASPAYDAPYTLDLPVRIRTLVCGSDTAWSDAERRELGAYYRSVTPLLAPVRYDIDRLDAEIDALGIPVTSVMQERPGFERPSTLLRIRGTFVNPGERVYAHVPAALHPLRDDQPANRLGLARWLVDRDNPLTARVTVNRAWEQFFGRGIVETSEDFGSQGTRPTHPELLDWLATELVERGWSLKGLHRLIVTSATYRQSSRTRPELADKDPANHLLARGPRFRMEAEMIRDLALAASGLLAPAIGGPSVFPVQPDGIWNVSRSGLDWKTSTGADRHRRTLYTFLRRSAPYPMLTTFDATSREVCTVRRVRTNTPLQALNLLNDPVFFEAAQGLAARIVREGGADARARATHGFRLCTGRMPSAADLTDLLALHDREQARIAAEKAADRILAGAAETPAAAAERVERAAWTMVANVLLNLDETQTKE